LRRRTCRAQHSIKYSRRATAANSRFPSPRVPRISLGYCAGLETLPGGGSSEWWIEGEGYGDANKAWINGRIGTGFDPRDSNKRFYLAKDTWVRNFGDASRRGEEKIAEARAANK